MKLTRSVLVLCLAATMVGCVATTGGARKPADPLNVENGSAFKGKQALAIGSFKVTYVTFDKSSAKATSSMFSSDSGFAKMTLRAKLEGIDDATFQGLTDYAYQDFTKRLQDNGYEIINRARIESAKGYAALPSTANPHKDTSSFTAITGGSRETATFAPTGLPLYHKGEYGGAPLPAPFGMYAVAQAAGVPTINVHYIVHFAYFEGATSNSLNVKTASVNMGQTVRVEHGSQAILAVGDGSTFNNPNAKINLTWGEASTQEYGTTSDATSGAQEAANAFSSVVGLLSGSSMAAREYLIQADPEKYTMAAKDVIGRTNAQFTTKMLSLR
ncbi:MAG TPA: hypothetical protein PK620_15440 [Denitromonas sp.]|uniref:hypothetical protein n=1 Tax=Denitromonas sp. TaxID=2734609 RepID=UPI001DF7433B|nr:hypothetical protein [Rhodocyclaceae bacterium]HQU90117.1 hypothetical protein [Denitromonas sp.]HQV16306.1 hypothetical protein [Denitromonas sp.]